jgi:hypothetical protein
LKDLARPEEYASPNASTQMSTKPTKPNNNPQRAKFDLFIIPSSG